VVTVQTLEHILIAPMVEALEALLALAFSEPTLDGLPERAFKAQRVVRLPG
jgi:hypothetical protein